MKNIDWEIVTPFLIKPFVYGYIIAVLSEAIDYHLSWPFIEVNLTNQTFLDINGWKWLAAGAIWFILELIDCLTDVFRR